MATTYATVLGLLAATGMRVGEVLSLVDDDIDWQQGLLTVRNGKFGKSRHVPLHETTVLALESYVKRRDSLLRIRRREGFFVSSDGARVLHQNFHQGFLKLLRITGIGRDAPRRPRLHDLRHTFAIRTLRDWYRRGYDVEQRLPSLSTYLGHVSPSTTYWYLTATPELLSVVSRRVLRAWGAVRS
jgi:integrase/recombinase XerD